MLAFRSSRPALVAFAAVYLGALSTAGDEHSPAADIEGARSAGMKTAWLSHGRKWPESLSPPTHTLANIIDLAAVLGL